MQVVSLEGPQSANDTTPAMLSAIRWQRWIIRDALPYT